MKTTEQIKAKRNALKREMHTLRFRFNKAVERGDGDAMEYLQSSIGVVIAEIRLLDWVLDEKQ
jgi:uncharacterized protein YlxP (DUF503 family)